MMLELFGKDSVKGETNAAEVCSSEPAVSRLTPTDLNVCLLVGWHLPEGERGHVAPHAEGLGQTSAGVAGVDQVCRKGEQPVEELLLMIFVSE